MFLRWKWIKNKTDPRWELRSWFGLGKEYATVKPYGKFWYTEKASGECKYIYQAMEKAELSVKEAKLLALIREWEENNHA